MKPICWRNTQSRVGFDFSFPRRSQHVAILLHFSFVHLLHAMLCLSWLVQIGIACSAAEALGWPSEIETASLVRRQRGGPDSRPSSSQSGQYHERSPVTKADLLDTPWEKHTHWTDSKKTKAQKHEALEVQLIRETMQHPAVKGRTNTEFFAHHFDAHVESFEKHKNVDQFLQRGVRAHGQWTIPAKSWEAAYELVRSKHPGKFAAYERTWKLKQALGVKPKA